MVPRCGFGQGEPPGLKAPAMKTDGQHSADARPQPSDLDASNGSPPRSAKTRATLSGSAVKPSGPETPMPKTSALSPRTSQHSAHSP